MEGVENASGQRLQNSHTNAEQNAGKAVIHVIKAKRPVDSRFKNGKVCHRAEKEHIADIEKISFQDILM